MVIIGTRPEIIKMAPVIRELKLKKEIECKVIFTGQHRELASSALKTFEIQVDESLDVMLPGQSSVSLMQKIIGASGQAMTRHRPDLVLVHGDTTSACGSAIAAHLLHIKVGHVEAGLRSGDLWAPWPEESNRRIIDSIASLHFAPTAQASEILKREGHQETTHITGNTIIDSIYWAKNVLSGPKRMILRSQSSHPDKKLVLVTSHRRESFGDPLRNVLRAIRKLPELGLEVVFPIHPNPEVKLLVNEILGENPMGISIIEPLEYLEMVKILLGSWLVITDSGGLQEEAPALGIPVLITRERTERQEVVDSGAAILVGFDEKLIFSEVKRLMESHSDYERMSKSISPYGDGTASKQIVDIILEWHLRT